MTVDRTTEPDFLPYMKNTPKEETHYKNKNNSCLCVQVDVNEMDGIKIDREEVKLATTVNI